MKTYKCSHCKHITEVPDDTKYAFCNCCLNLMGTHEVFYPRVTTVYTKEIETIEKKG